MPIEKEELRSLIPHSGDMCLLDRVLEWNTDEITCSSNSHRDVANPLFSENRLSSVHVIEYGAQAMAVHGGLLSRQDSKSPRAGYLASVKKITLDIAWLHEIEEPLVVYAKKLMGDDSAMIYEFKVSITDKIIAEGQTTVIQTTVINL